MKAKFLPVALFMASVILLVPSFPKAEPIGTWHWRNPLPEGNHLKGVAYGNGTFVVVGWGGTILTSSDGMKWELSALKTNVDLEEVTYGNGIFVAVGDTILTSPDGVTWTEATSGNHPFLKGVTYGSGTFVAVGIDRTILTSSDGMNWILRPSPDISSGEDLMGVSYGDGMYVVVGAYGIAHGGSYSYTRGIVVTSNDGIEWVVQTRNVELLKGVVYANGIFIAVGGGAIRTSPDGLTWTQRSVGWSQGGEGVAYGDGTFVVVGDEVFVSSDGTNWTQKDSGTKNALRAVSYGNHLFVAVGDGGVIMTSSDGTMWTERSQGTSFASPSEMTWGGGIFVAVGSTILTSQTGAVWTERPSGTDSLLKGVSYGNGLFVAIGNGGTILTSSDAIAWITRDSGTTADLEAVDYCHGTWVAVGKTGTILTSNDGTSWQKRESGVDTRLAGVTWGNGIFVVIGDSGSILTSPDGATWTRRDSGAGSRGLNDVVFGNGLFVVAGGSGYTTLTSVDGVNWTTNGSYNPYRSLIALAYGNGTFIAVGTEVTPYVLFKGRYIVTISSIFTSHDGIAWEQQPIVDRRLNDVVFGYGTFVTVGDYATILQSDPVVPVETVSTPTTPTGPTTVTTNYPSLYSTGDSTSSLGHSVEYQFDWFGDGTTDLSSWGSATQSRTWTPPGTYSIRARARSTTDSSAVSGWSPGLWVSIEQCTHSVSPNTVTLGWQSGSGSVSVTAGNNCSWTASTNSGSWDWIGISSGWSGTGDGTVNYYVLANNSSNLRTGTLTIAGQTFTITQQGCSGSISPTSNTFGKEMGFGVVDVTAGDGCSWSASTNPQSWDWIGISLGWDGTGNRSVHYFVLPNYTGVDRTGTLTIAGQTFTITQSGSVTGPCGSYRISPTSKTFDKDAGSAMVNVTADPGCLWSAWTNPESWDWIGISSGWNGTGNGAVNYFVLANNTGNTRTGTVTIAGQTFTITQEAGGGCTYTISPIGVTFAKEGGADNVTVTTSSGCSWTGSTNPASWDWIGISSGWNGTGNGVVNYFTLPNNTGRTRIGMLTIAGQTFVVTQGGE